MPANREAKRERQPWRGAAKQDIALPSRPLKRAGAMLVGVLLLAAFAWLVWQVIRPAPRLIAATWTVGDYDLLSAPPLPFARQSLAEFRRIVADDSFARDTATSQTDEELTAFCKDLAQYRGGARDDLLVAFVIAHGVSVVEPAVEPAAEPAQEADNSGDDNPRSPEAAWRAVPYLLCSNYQPGQTGDDPIARAAEDTRQGMVPLDTLIDALVACPVGHKLLLLDCGSVENDPALGMLVNEFPKLLAEKIAATGDPNLCVLISHGVGQRSLADRGKKASVFARCVNQAWADHARRQDSRELTLVEFTQALAAKVEESAEQLTDGALSQKPTLLWGGGDRARQSVVVMPRIGKGPAVGGDSAVPEADVKPAAAQARLLPTGDERVAVAQAAGQAAPEAADSSPASNEPSSESKQAAGQPPAQSDELGRASARVSAAAPVAGANSTTGNPDPKHGDEKSPHATEGEPRGEAKAEKKKDTNPAGEPKSLWESRWAECDRLTGDASAWSPIDFAPNAWRDYCERLVAAEQRDGLGLSIAPAALEEPAWDVLAQTFASQAARYEQHQDIVQAVRLRNELLFRLPYHIRWMTAGASTVDDDTLGELFPIRLFDDLAGLVHSLADPPRAAKAGAADDVARWRAELRRQAANLEAFQQKIDRRLSDEIATLTHPKRASNEGGDLPRIDNLLVTPLLTASERSRLHQTIAKKLARTSASNRPAKLWRRAELEWRLWNVIASRRPTSETAGATAQPSPVSRDFPARLDQLVLEAPSTSSDAILALGELHQEFWALGNLQRDAYRRLENDLFTLARATNNAARLADATLRLIDGRRAGQILKRRSDYDPIDPVNRPLLPDLGIQHPMELVRLLPRGGQAVTLEIDKPSTLAWSVRYERPGTRKLTWWITYDDTADDVTVSFDGRPLASGQRQELTFQPGEPKKELRCAVVPRREADRGPIEITLHVAAADAQAVTDGVAVSLPRRQPLRLAVAPRASATVSSLDHATVVELRPFFSPQPPDEPRPTRFRLSLVNDAPLGKQVTYQWFALPADPETLRRACEGEDIAARCRRLYGTKEKEPLSILAGGELPLDLPFPKPPAAAGGAANAAPADAPPPASAGHDIAAGLVLDVAEVEVKAEGAAPVAKPRQRFVIQVAPQHPKDYLAPPKVEYLPLDEKLTITVEPIEAGALPPDGTKVVWEMEDKRLKTAADKKTVAKLSPKNAQDTMYARLSPKPDEKIEVQLTVDGYPRAFAYDVRCDEVAHAPSQNKLEYFKHVDMQIVRDKADNEPADGPLIFGNVPSIRVRLRADAPREWFAAPNHRIEVGIETSDGPDGEPIRFAADRLVDLRAAAGTASGDWEILATVRDLELPLDTEGRADSRFDVVARLTLESIEVRRTVVLDGLAPQLRGLEAEVTGESISASVRAREASDAESGVDRVEFTLLKSVEWRKVKDEAAWPKVAQVESADRPGADGRWSIELKRPPEPGNYVVLARAFDNADNESEVGDYPLTVSKPPSAKAMAGDGKNSLFGTFTVRGGKPDPGANWRVSLKGPKNVGPIPANSGSYSFKGLPPGKYELKITGDFGKIETWGPREITIEAPPAKATVDRWDLGSDDGQAK